MSTRPAPQFHNVLCPVDFSEYSRTALRYAFALAQMSEGQLTVLFVNDPLLGTAAAAASYDIEALEAKTVGELRRFVARAIGTHARLVKIVTAVGHAAPEIQSMAERLGVDVVVLGSRGLTGPGKWFFGSTTERVLRNATVPVLVVPKSRRRQGRGANVMRSWPGKHILVPVDLNDYVAADVRRALEVVQAFGAKARLVYVLSPIQLPPWLRGLDRRGFERKRIEEARTQLDKLAQSAGGDADCQVVIGDPVDQIAACATDARAGLIILMLKRASAAFGPRQGVISYQVLSTSVAPILAIPAIRRR